MQMFRRVLYFGPMVAAAVLSMLGSVVSAPARLVELVFDLAVLDAGAALQADIIRHEVDAVPIARGKGPWKSFIETARNHARYIGGLFTQGESVQRC